MKVRYKGIIVNDGRVRASGCGACGGRRLVSSGNQVFRQADDVWVDGRHFHFALGQVRDVPDDVAEYLLKKFSYRSGIKYMAYEVVND